MSARDELSAMTFKAVDAVKAMNEHDALAAFAETHHMALRLLDAIERSAPPIAAKCEQYWNEHNIAPSEVHAILEYVRRHVEILERALKGEPPPLKETEIERFP